MRSYGEFCSIAKALDVVGDRWSLLIIRELVIRDGLRYTDLKDGLPGIATNLLSDRIRELEAKGLIRREDAPPPVATTLFHLTEDGRQLLPVLEALSTWGLRYMPGTSETDAFRSQWFAFPVSQYVSDHCPDGPPATIELRAAGTQAALELTGNGVRLRPGPGTTSADLVLDGEPRLILGMFTGLLTAREAVALGLETTGDTSLLDRILPQPRAGKVDG
jgi:DNA-binding HxlR family transcriptional regulator